MVLKKSVVGAILIAGAIVFIHELAVLKKSPNQQSSQLFKLNTMILISPAFQDNGLIPQKYTCDGGDINPELRIQYVPRDAKSLALIVDDPDAPGGTFTHWTVWNISPTTTVIKEESVPPGSVEGQTSFGRIGYGGPCPPASPAGGPSGKPHRYFFRLFALNAWLDLPPGASRANLEKLIAEHLTLKAELVGLYSR